MGDTLYGPVGYSLSIRLISQRLYYVVLGRKITSQKVQGWIEEWHPMSHRIPLSSSFWSDMSATRYAHLVLLQLQYQCGLVRFVEIMLHLLLLNPFRMTCFFSFSVAFVLISIAAELLSMPAEFGHETGYSPGLVASQSQSTQRQRTIHSLFTVAFTPKDHLESSMNLACIFLEYGRKLEFPS